MSKLTFKTEHDLIFFDLETTGVDIDKDRIVQIAVLKYPAGAWTRRTEPKQRIKLLLDPTVPIPDEASEVHGIYDKDVEGKKTFRQIAKRLHGVFKNCVVCGYNSRTFDTPLLRAEFRRCGIDWKPVAQVDAFHIFKQLLPHSLEGAMQVYCGESIEGAHDAMNDISATVEVLWAQLMRHPELQYKSPAEIEEYTTDPNAVDIDGKLVRNDEGEICLNFSKYKGKPITDIDQGFWNWCRKNNVLTQDTWDIVNKVL